MEDDMFRLGTKRTLEDVKQTIRDAQVSGGIEAAISMARLIGRHGNADVDAIQYAKDWQPE